MRLLKEIRNLLGNYHVKSGIYHYYREEYRQAAEFLQKALHSDEKLTASDLRTARYYLTLCFTEAAQKYEDEGQIESALTEYENAVAVSPTYPDIRLKFGRALERQNRPEQAVEQYRQASTTRRPFLDAWVALGFCLLEMKKHEEAADAFRNASEIKTDKVLQPFKAGITALESGNSDQAHRSFHRAFLFVPDLFETHHRKALRLLKKEDYENALLHIDAAIELNPDYLDLHNFRGVTLCEMDRIDEAAEAFRTSMSMNEHYVIPKLNLAFTLLRAGDVKEGEAILESVLEEDPTEPAAQAKLKELRAAQPNEAVKKRRSVNRGSGR
jgi:Tfp pilus assembly protein PilF